MHAIITGYESLSCFGDAEQTFRALLQGRCGVSPLRPHPRSADLGVRHGYYVPQGVYDRLTPQDPPGADDDPDAGDPWRATRLLAHVVRTAAGRARLDARYARVAVLVGTGLRELGEAERWRVHGAERAVSDLHFGAAVRRALPGVTEVLTVSNACSASGYALALGQDLLDAGEVDAVVVAGADTMTTSLLAVMGRGSPQASPAVRPFETDRRGVLLGEGAAAVVLERPGHRQLPVSEPPLAHLHGVGLSCDAHHETAPHAVGVTSAMHQAFARSQSDPGDIELIVAHGTGTALNDPLEAHVLTEVHGARSAPVTAIKGGTGHTSGAAALMSVIVAGQAMRSGLVPPISGLDSPIPEAGDLDLVTGGPRRVAVRLAQVDAFGFGGVNAVAVVGAAA